MKIKFEIRPVHNVKGTDAKHFYAKVVDIPPTPEDQLEQRIEDSCSLTKGDVKAAFSAFANILINELRDGKRVTLPGVGSFSLAVKVHNPQGKPAKKIKGNDLRLHTIAFRPCKTCLQEVARGMSFERSKNSSPSSKYTEEQMHTILNDYFTTHSYLDRNSLQHVCNLRQTKALQWLRQLTLTGFLRKEGSRTAPIYFLNSASELK